MRHREINKSSGPGYWWFGRSLEVVVSVGVRLKTAGSREAESTLAKPESTLVRLLWCLGREKTSLPRNGAQVVG